MGQRRRAREHALQILFQIDLTRATPAEVFLQFWADRPDETDDRRFSEELVLGVDDKKADMDKLISESASNWRIERMAVVDRNVLRMAVYELLQEDETPPAVVIDEAIEVAKKFGSEDSGSFINGILDSIRRRLKRDGRSS